jgi:branched-chain amino acid transport system ATP-binding protein
MHTPQIAGLNIAYVPENMGIFADLTVKENMLLAARSAKRGADGRARLQWIFKLFPAVEKFWNHPAGKLSRAGRSRCWPWRAPSSSRASC